MLFADVVVPFPLADSFTYAVPADMEQRMVVGQRVVVPFGARKHYTAVVLELHRRAPEGYEVKEIYDLLDEVPVVNEGQLKLWRWISFYYMASLGEVMTAALPGQLRLEGDGLVSSGEAVRERYRARTMRMVALNSEVVDADEMIGRAAKQRELYGALLKYFGDAGVEELSRARVLKRFGYSASVLKGLVDKGLLLEYERDVSRIDLDAEVMREPYPLNEHQEVALQEIKEQFEEKQVCLLHGVTSSGKTEIYIHLIQEQLKRGKQVLYLLPEIALTTQLTARLRAVFGDKLGVYHSRIDDNERVEIWQKMHSDEPFEVVIGVRSSVFLPFYRLGLVIVDEEHEASYRQQSPAPRYHARDVSIVMAQDYGAKVLLGSATPSMESYYNAQQGKYGLVSLLVRHEEIELPEIVIEDTFELRRKRQMKTLLAPRLMEEMELALERGEQVILFRNRRGYVPMLECKNCGWTPKCNQCDVSLTYHKYSNEFKCHYCGRSYKLGNRCQVCNEESMEPVGMGTEKLAEEVAALFPQATIGRLDRDSVGSKYGYEEIIGRFEEGVTDILIGTQMLSKGLDFENVSVVGIMAADGLLSHPDFRSHERGFQLMMQSAGRAGRKHRRGKVVIQAANPKIPVYQYLLNNDYKGFFDLQVSERQLFRYPPFTRQIVVVLRHKEEQVVEGAARYFADGVRGVFDSMVLGPSRPMVGYVQLMHIREILLKVEGRHAPAKVREVIKAVEQRLRGVNKYKYVRIHYDVDRA